MFVVGRETKGTFFANRTNQKFLLEDITYVRKICGFIGKGLIIIIFQECMYVPKKKLGNLDMHENIKQI